MAEVAANQADHQQYESKNISCKEKKSEVVNSHSQWGNSESGETEESTENMSKTELLKKGFMEHGCPHYQRRCRIRAPCCNKIFDCRHCHNEAMNSISVDQKLRHDIPRHQVKQVICSLCDTEQQVQQVCVNCGVCVDKLAQLSPSSSQLTITFQLPTTIHHRPHSWHNQHVENGRGLSLIFPYKYDPQQSKKHKQQRERNQQEAILYSVLPERVPES